MPRSVNPHKHLPPPDPYPDDDDDEAPRIRRPRAVHDRSMMDAFGRAVSSPIFDTAAEADPWLPEPDGTAGDDDGPVHPPRRRRH